MSERPTMTDEQIKYMVDRFLQWKLPENFNPDGGISFKKTFNERAPWGPMKHEPVGTNLLDAIQTEAMVRYLVEGLPNREQTEPPREKGWLKPILEQVHAEVNARPDWQKKRVRAAEPAPPAAPLDHPLGQATPRSGHEPWCDSQYSYLTRYPCTCQPAAPAPPAAPLCDCGAGNDAYLACHADKCALNKYAQPKCGNCARLEAENAQLRQLVRRTRTADYREPSLTTPPDSFRGGHHVRRIHTP